MPKCSLTVDAPLLQMFFEAYFKVKYVKGPFLGIKDPLKFGLDSLMLSPNISQVESLVPESSKEMEK